jgi:hypothetical protein
MAACGAAVLQAAVGRRRVLPAGIAVVAALLAILQGQNFRHSPDEWSYRKFRDRLLMSRRAADLLNQVLLPGETFFQWGHHPELYYYSGRAPAAGEFRTRNLLQGTGQAERTTQLLHDLQSSRPELIILVAGHEFPLEHPVPRWIMENYETLAAQPCDAELARRFLVLARRDGRLLNEAESRPCLSASNTPEPT